MKPRIYIAGPCTGLPLDNYPAFNAEAARLRSIGFIVENPAESPRQDNWLAYMRQSIRQMLTCDAVALLPAWKRSKGALIEHGLAISLGIKARPCAEYQAKQADPKCWLCDGSGWCVDDNCPICMEVKA